MPTHGRGCMAPPLAFAVAMVQAYEPKNRSSSNEATDKRCGTTVSEKSVQSRSSWGEMRQVLVAQRSPRPFPLQLRFLGSLNTPAQIMRQSHGIKARHTCLPEMFRPTFSKAASMQIVRDKARDNPNGLSGADDALVRVSRTHHNIGPSSRRITTDPLVKQEH